MLSSLVYSSSFCSYCLSSLQPVDREPAALTRYRQLSAEASSQSRGRRSHYQGSMQSKSLACRSAAGGISGGWQRKAVTPLRLFDVSRHSRSSACSFRTSAGSPNQLPYVAGAQAAPGRNTQRLARCAARVTATEAETAVVEQQEAAAPEQQEAAAPQQEQQDLQLQQQKQQQVQPDLRQQLAVSLRPVQPALKSISSIINAVDPRIR